MVTMPVQQGFVVTSPFGPRSGGYHYGTDFGLAGGSGGKPVFAVKDGTVTRSGPASGFGRWVTIDHPATNGGGETVYGHIVPEVTAGQAVKEGQRIGRIDPDRATNGGVAPHLHLEWHRYSWAPPGPDRLDPMTKLAGAKWLADESTPEAPAPKQPAEEAPVGKTVIDFSAAYPAAEAVKAARHTGVMLYLSPARDSWMGGKKITRQVVDGYKNAGLGVAVVWQYGAGNARDSDVMRGAAGGVADARAAEAKLKEVGLDGHPVFFAVDFDASLTQWNNTIVKYFRAACDVLGRDRVGIYGASHVVHWAMEDKVVAEVAPGRVLGWITRSWSNGVIGADYSVLYQRVHNVPGPSGVQIDINDIQHEYWGQRPPKSMPGLAPAPKPEEPTVTDIDAELERYLKVEPEQTRIMNKHFTQGRGGAVVEFITRHHTAGILNLIQIWGVWQNRAASAHYLSDPAGVIGQLVWDSDTAWSNGNSWANARTITIEHSNSAGAGADWPISEATILAGARWAAALCLRFNLGRPVFGKNIRDHVEFSSTSCPYHLRRGWKYHDKWMREAETFYDRLVAYRDRTPTIDSKEELTMSQYNDLKAQQDRIERKVDLILDQLAGPERNEENGLPAFTGWPQLGDRTLIDFFAAQGAAVGVADCKAIDSCPVGTEEGGDTPCLCDDHDDEKPEA